MGSAGHQRPKLSEAEREKVLRLRREEQLPVAAIAERMGVSKATVRKVVWSAPDGAALGLRDPARAAEARRRYEAGESVSTICLALGLDTTSFVGWVRRHQLRQGGAR